MLIEYASHGGIHKVAVVHAPSICGDRLVHLSQDDQHSWVIRDYIGEQQLRRAPPPNPSYSQYDLRDIEAAVVYSELPPNYAYEMIGDWRTHLQLRSSIVLPSVSAAPPSSAFGDWQPLGSGKTND